MSLKLMWSIALASRLIPVTCRRISEPNRLGMQLKNWPIDLIQKPPHYLQSTLLHTVIIINSIPLALTC